MRSNSLDFSSFETINMPVYKKTERSHEENQERAYIAASRRTDRSLEARVQSAHMASDIHKRRTGKSFRITDEIVMKEEMYEEEDDDLPRSYKILGANMQTASPHMNHRVEAYLSNKANMSAMLARTNEEWRQNEVNTLFDQMFPHASVTPHRSPALVQYQQQQEQQRLLQQRLQHQQQQQQQQHGPFHHQGQQHQGQQPHEQQHHEQQRHEQQQHHQQHHQQHQYGQQQHQQQPMHQQFQHPPQYVYPQDYPTSALGQYPHPPDFTRQDSGIGISTPLAKFENSSQPDSPIDLGSSRSAFTTELPAEARMMMGSAGETQGYEHSPHNWASLDPSFDMSGVSCDPKIDEQLVSLSGEGEAFETTSMKWDQAGQPMPPVDETTWNTFINDSAWASDQQ